MIVLKGSLALPDREKLRRTEYGTATQWKN